MPVTSDVADISGHSLSTTLGVHVVNITQNSKFHRDRRPVQYSLKQAVELFETLAAQAKKTGYTNILTKAHMDAVNNFINEQMYQHKPVIEELFTLLKKLELQDFYKELGQEFMTFEKAESSQFIKDFTESYDSNDENFAENFKQQVSKRCEQKRQAVPPPSKSARLKNFFFGSKPQPAKDEPEPSISDKHSIN
ncbi:MAG: hypothetical protein CMF38_07030 [Legionellaceae bacterium]|nr:hypothetical protein [Legionellaceae bacterium]HAF87749.1 hypothetical protein [Legionellales bacterium]HCA88908.1 hypothetical protein [Legionellales bacterium]|tara:strand:- start:312 stop:893 length:582 start_codon:yes stop_codon:yes gene_type:complete